MNNGKIHRDSEMAYLGETQKRQKETDSEVRYLLKQVPYKNMISEREIDRYRAEFPILAEVIHLGNCSQSAQSIRVRRAIDRYLDSWMNIGMDWEIWVEEVRLAKVEFAKLINAEVSEIAIASSVSDLVSSIANAFTYQGSRRKVLLTDAEFPTVNYIWLANQRNGAQVDFVNMSENYTIDCEDYYRHIDEDTLLTTLSHVNYLSGFKQNLGALVDLAHSRGSLVLVDAYQSLGTDPIDVQDLDIDILVSGCLKYLFGTPGVAFMYIKQSLIEDLKPSVTGWFGQKDPFLFQSRQHDWSDSASRFDTGTPPIMNAYAARAGLQIINEIGPQRIKDRIDMLSAHALVGCLDRHLEVISPYDISQKGSTTAIKLPIGYKSNVAEKILREQGIIVSARGQIIRIAPHFYNKPLEIEYALDALESILA